MEVTNNAGTVVYGSVVNPTGATTSITLASSTLTATTALTQYKIRVTPKTHANLPVGVLGQVYDVTATVLSWTGVNQGSGSDLNSGTVSIDNGPPGPVVSTTIVPGDSKFNLTYTAPSDSDLGQIVVLISSSPIVAVPAEGTVYFSGNVLGTSIVGCVDSQQLPGAISSCMVNGLSNGTTYYIKVFTVDTRGNYSAGAAPTPATVIPTVPSATEKLASYRYRNDDGGDTTATYKASENTPVTSGFVKGDKIRVRFTRSLYSVESSAASI